jgi:hypothetical protein
MGLKCHLCDQEGKKNASVHNIILHLSERTKEIKSQSVLVCEDHHYGASDSWVLLENGDMVWEGYIWD